MSHYVRKSKKGRYYTSGKKYSVETYASIFKAVIEYKKMTGDYPLPSHLSEIVSVSFKVAKKAILFVSGETTLLHKPRGHGFSGKGSMKLTMVDQFFLLGLYNEDPSRPLYSYITELYKFSGTNVSTSTISKWFNYSFNFKASCRKTSIFPAQKFSSTNIRKLEKYVKVVSMFHHSRFVFTDEKPMKGVDIYNKKIRRSPLDGSVPFVDTGYDIRNTYNLMAAIKINNNENSIESMSDGTTTNNIAYQIGKYRGTSTAFKDYVTQLLVTGFLQPGHVLICDNASIHVTEENRILSEILWEHKILMLNLPPYSPKLNPIELIFQLLSHRLRHSNARHLSQQLKSEDFFLLKCVEVLESITDKDVRKSYRKCGYYIE